MAHRSAHRRHLSPDARRPCRTRTSRWRCPRSAAARRRSRGSTPTAIASAGCSRRHDARHEHVMRLAISLVLVALVICARIRVLRRRQQPRPRVAPAPTLARPTSPTKAPDAAGFLQRWLAARADPRDRAAHRERRAGGRQEGVLSRTSSPSIPHDGDTVTVGDEPLAWHAVDTIDYNVNLYHFAYALKKPTSNVLFWAVTVVDVAARDARRAPRDRLERRVALVAQRRGGHRHLQRSADRDRRWRVEARDAEERART